MQRISHGRAGRWVMSFPATALFPALLACGGADRQPADAEPAGTAAAGAAAAGSGEQLYQQRCVSCHQANGQGLAGAFPPLVGSEYALAANKAVPIRVVLHGMQGPVTVKGVQYNGVMPPGGAGIAMSDEETAAVLTYVRSAWGNSASAVTPQEVAAERAAPRSATGPTTAEELAPLLQ
ncbi:MAG TPA: cytochrome c [Gemmatimonadaceae bacterium]|nr:cytochrome c [Gemmatimonadaceae bacterium]